MSKIFKIHPAIGVARVAIIPPRSSSVPKRQARPAWRSPRRPRIG